MNWDFKPVEISDKPLIDSYSIRYGENSCQHSFVSMYGHFGKYGDSFFEKDGWLYLCRTHLKRTGEKVYLCPLGNPNDKRGFAKALENVLADAASEGKRAVFETVTAKARERMEKAMPGRFKFTYSRDFSEYVYSRDKLVKLSGVAMAKKRYQYNSFQRKYEGRIRVEHINERLLPEILDFQSSWMFERMQEGDAPELMEENEAIQREIGEFTNLALSGIIIRIDGNIVGYAYGAALSDECFDVFVGKGDRKVDHIYRALNRKLPESCARRFRCFNWEEDLGDTGLRQMKMDYHPDVLMEKYIARENYE